MCFYCTYNADSVFIKTFKMSLISCSYMQFFYDYLLTHDKEELSYINFIVSCCMAEHEYICTLAKATHIKVVDITFHNMHGYNHSCV